jgi:glycosyltransferase involved in cell wall biosynthesis
MRVLYVSPYPPARDGIGDYTDVLATAIRDRGNDVRVVMPRPGRGSPSEVVGTIGWLPWRERSARRRIAEFRPDVVHVQFAVAAFGTRAIILARWLRALRHDLGVPVIVTMHEVTRDTALLRAFGRAIYRRIAAGCDLAIVHTQAASAALTGQVGVPAEKVTVIPHPAARLSAGAVEPAGLRDRFGIGSARVLLAFGFVHVDKGLQDLVGALGALRRLDGASLDDVRVVVAGAVRRRHGLFRVFEARDRLHLRQVLHLARRIGVRDDLVLTGYVPDAEVDAWFCMAEAVVLPYRRIEQSGVAGLAIAREVPVLTSQVGGLDEQFDGSPWTFPARDPAALALVLARFLATPPDKRGPAWQARRSVDVPAVAAATLHVYADAVDGTAGRLAHVG